MPPAHLPHTPHPPPSFVQPFVDADHPFQQYFPERKWAIIIPTLLFALVLTVAGTFVGLVMIKSTKKTA